MPGRLLQMLHASFRFAKVYSSFLTAYVLQWKDWPATSMRVNATFSTRSFRILTSLLHVLLPCWDKSQLLSNRTSGMTFVFPSKFKFELSSQDNPGMRRMHTRATAHRSLQGRCLEGAQTMRTATGVTSTRTPTCTVEDKQLWKSLCQFNIW